MTNKTSLIPTEGILTKEGLQPANYNIDSYVSMMESVSHSAKGAAGMGSPTANRMKARAAEGMIPLVAAITGILEDPALAEKFASQGVAAGKVSGEAFRKFVDAEIDKWGALIREAKIMLE